MPRPIRIAPEIRHARHAGERTTGHRRGRPPSSPPVLFSTAETAATAALRGDTLSKDMMTIVAIDALAAVVAAEQTSDGRPVAVLLRVEGEVLPPHRHQVDCMDLLPSVPGQRGGGSYTANTYKKVRTS